jgi:hypothetical protein
LVSLACSPKINAKSIALTPAATPPTVSALDGESAVEALLAEVDRVASEFEAPGGAVGRSPAASLARVNYSG